MSDELINSIELLQNKIEELESEYEANIRDASGFDSLDGIHRQIRECKQQLAVLELQLLDSLPRKIK